MSDLITRAEQALALLEDSSLPKWQRFKEALHTFSGTELGPLDTETRTDLESGFLEVNEVLRQYDIESDEDMESISGADLDRLCGLVRTTATEAIEGELSRILRELDEADDELPEDAIQEARKHRERVIPLLIQSLEEAVARVRAGEFDRDESHLPFFCLFLLTEFGAREAFPVLLEALTLPGEHPYDLFGDGALTMLPRVLAYFAPDDLELIDSIARNGDIDEFVRWGAADAYPLLVRDGRLARDQAVERLRGLLRWAIERRDEEIAPSLIYALAELGPGEAMEEIREAYREDMVPVLTIELREVEQRLERGSEEIERDLERLPPSGMPDTIEELRRWAWFAEPATPSEPESDPVSEPDRVTLVEAPSAVSPTVAVHEPVAPIKSRANRVGRNDPCPCGSGKKYKKCCMRK